MYMIASSILSQRPARKGKMAIIASLTVAFLCGIGLTRMTTNYKHDLTVKRANTHVNDQSSQVESYPISITPIASGQLRESETDQPRPILYTFFTRINEDEKMTGMSNEEDDQLLDLWRQEWSDAGWDLKVLDMSHAQMHPRFEEFEEKLLKINLKGPNTVYNRFCYYRWLAMSAVGGGWMSDYDILPLKQEIKPQAELPQNGNFIVYHATAEQTKGAIPCLMSGSASEWERMAFEIVENGVQHPESDLWSDMSALIDIFDNNTYIVDDVVLKGFQAMEILEWTPNECESISKGKLAVHFSHASMKILNIPVNTRPVVAGEWIKMWKAVCTKPSFQEAKF